MYINAHRHMYLNKHRIPSIVQPEHIVDMFQSRTHVTPVGVDPIIPTGNGTGAAALGRTTARFLSKAHADLAFETLTGPARPDKGGRDQKRVYLAGNKDYLQVRLMYAKADEGKGEDGDEEEEDEEDAAEEEEATSAQRASSSTRRRIKVF